MNSTMTAFTLSRVPGLPVSDEELLADLKSAATATGTPTIGQLLYRQVGKYADSTLVGRFGSWNKALLAAELSISNQWAIPDLMLFENLLLLWKHYGRQPRKAALSVAPSTVSQSPYNRRFGSWSAALEAFVVFANTTEAYEVPATTSPSPRRTGREPSLRLRWAVLHRDRFTCCACGASPAISIGVQLQVDHILAWSNGGETESENLQTLCSVCNLGKSNA